MSLLKILINLISEEIELYSTLNNLFEYKRQVLISNSVEDLLSVDEKILNTVDSIKSAVHHRQIITSKLGYMSLNLTQMIELANDIDIYLANEIKESQIQINELIKEIAHKERIIKELIRHGMNLVNKKLNIFSNATTIAGDYNSYGQNVQGELGRISSVIEEV